MAHPPTVSAEATAKPKLNPSVPSDAVQIQQRLFDLGYLSMSADGKWGQRSARALREFRAAHNLKSDAVWDQQTEDALLSSPITPGAETTLPFAGNWRSEDGSCVADGNGPPLRITTARAETAGGRCDFNSIQTEAESTWRVRAKCFVNGETWQANIQLRLTGQGLIWNSERGRAQYLRCK
jgi:peptidoglycan hydrolase-like protein with peptidoglycan-binding domain